MLTLAFDTTSKTISVALMQGEQILVELFSDMGRQHGETLLPAIDQVLSHARYRPEEIDLFVCTAGPGSFTGLRVGVATATGLARAFNKPAIGVSSLDALAQNVSHTAMTICCMLDARRGEVYTSLYRTLPGDLPLRISAEEVLVPEILLAGLDKDVLFVGDGADLYADTIRNSLGNRAHFAAFWANRIRASAVGAIGLKNITGSGNVHPLNVTPRYIRPSYAGM